MLFSDSEYWLTRFLFQRSLGVIYLVAFAAVVQQFVPLCGERGILPAPDYIQHRNFWDSPSIFWFHASDRLFCMCGWIGVGLSLLALSGISDAFGIYVSVAVWGALWLLYLSYVNIGQVFFAFGWESLLLETGFLSIFFGSNDTKVPVIIIWLLRWLLFRLMFGAGLIKIRGDQCWRDLTCMLYHYETQPLPNPLSWYFHRLPVPLHKGAVLFNHFVELIVPFGYFVRGRIAALAGIFTFLFQLLLIVSGNFSWLNYLSLVVSISCFRNQDLAFLPFKPGELFFYRGHEAAVWLLAFAVFALSIRPALNLLSERQLMNASFEPLHIVNTYGAFGSITRVRREIIIEGSMEPEPNAEWKAYEFIAKPGDPLRRPPLIAPYHLRLDWLMWFAPLGSFEYSPWFQVFLEKLLEGDSNVLSLIKSNPFPDQPPRYLRAKLYEYHFTDAAERQATGAFWKRTELGLFCPIASLN